LGDLGGALDLPLGDLGLAGYIARLALSFPFGRAGIAFAFAGNTPRIRVGLRRRRRLQQNEQPGNSYQTTKRQADDTAPSHIWTLPPQGTS
ncbi:MAG: hypothetical protein ABR540_09425, partial [Acidimicrobiales bacterium]